MKYVVGFAFDASALNLVLIKKNKPEWQMGQYNGVGGKIEDGESDSHAMSREFQEETGVEIYESNWKKFATLYGAGFEVHFFYFRGDEIYGVKTMTPEIVKVVSVDDLSMWRVIPNLKWLIPMALDNIAGKTKTFGNLFVQQ